MLSLNRRVFLKTNGRCWYCGVVLDWVHRNAPSGFHVDHAVPRARDGSDDFENLMPACSSCNGSKGVKSVDEFRRYVVLISISSGWEGFSETEKQYIMQGLLIGDTSAVLQKIEAFRFYGEWAEPAWGFQLAA